MYFKTDKMESLERAGSDAIMSVTQGGNNYRVCYSCHSSLEELKTFVQYFLPKRIIPCAIPSSSSREEVAKILLSFLNPEKKDEEEEEDPNQSQIISNQVQQFTEFSQVNVPPRDSGSEFDSFDWFNDLSEKKNIENKNTSAEKFRISFDNTVTINLRRDGGESTDDEIEDFDERMEENEEKEEKRRNLVVGSWSSIEIIPGIIQESSDCEAEVNICTITPTSFKGEEVFSETTKVSSLSRRKKFARSKTDKTYYSMPVHPDTEMEANHPKERRSSMPSNMKLPLIKVTPSSPSIDFNHPDYPEFFQDKLYLEHVGKPLSGGKKGEGCNDGRSREGSRDSELNLKLSEDTDENSSLDHPACSADATSSYPAAATPAYPAADTLTSGCITSSCASAPASVCLAPTVPVSTAASPPTGHASVSPVCEKDNDLDSPNDVRRFKRQLSVFNQPEEDDCLIYKKQKVYDGVQGPNSSPNTREDQTVNSNNQGNSANINLLESQNIFETDESQDMFLQKSQDILQESQDMFNPKESQDMFNSQESQDMFNSQESQDILNDPISPDARYLVKSQTKQMQDSRDVIIIDDSQETTQVQESQVILDLNYSHESTENLLDGKECLKRKPDANLNHDTFEPKKKQKKDSNVKYNPEQLDSSTHPVEIIHNTVELESLNDLNDMENKEVNQKEAKNMKEDHDDKDEHEDGKEDDEDDKDPPDLDFLLREAEEKNYPEHVMRNLRYMDECRKNIIQID
ncbi:uncharacterized protein LOC111701104 isoform X3 [Eurytemora carolleeae]|uniref:uncharacterized protein LOC111701104 isoform X3 n=1 Tax=Eurytemora carolleeae TaxID=1294199 RepID=UPI000C786695|nr:uncharacterized protein LOC111701104 isoform X3 [Eurytemora carolleeae]|eukprot:XP_023328022.1 uncharacterized protein LOC111701104 isoform X3 [Eurytemora affinis]